MQHPLTEFWDGPGVDRIIEQMELIKLSMGTNSRTSSQSIRSGPILDVAGFRSARVQTNTAACNGCVSRFHAGTVRTTRVLSLEKHSVTRSGCHVT